MSDSTRGNCVAEFKMHTMECRESVRSWLSRQNTGKTVGETMESLGINFDELISELSGPKGAGIGFLFEDAQPTKVEGTEETYELSITPGTTLYVRESQLADRTFSQFNWTTSENDTE